MSQWTRRALADVCLTITDGSHYSPTTTEKGVPYITVRDLTGGVIDFTGCKLIAQSDYADLRRNGCAPRRGDVLFSKDGTVGKVALVDTDEAFVVLSSLAILRPDPALMNSRFLAFSLQSPDFLSEAIGRKTGVAIRRVILKNLKSMLVSVPPLEEQRRIVAVLDEAFAAIATANANAQKNLMNARELFTSYILAAIRPGNQGLKRIAFGEFCKLQRGFDLPMKDRRPGSIPLISSSGVIDAVDRAMVCGPGVVTGRSGSIGNVFYEVEDFWPLNTTLYIKDFFGNSARFVYHFLRAFNLKRYATGTGVPTLNRNFVNVAQVWVPTEPVVQQRMADAFDEIEGHVERLSQTYVNKVAGLSRLKQSLLDRAFAGELTPPERELVTA